MHYVTAFDRDQMMMTTWDPMVGPESTARLINAFVNSLNLADYGIKEMAPEGRPPYDPKSLLKLYIYGSDNGIKSSRKLAKNCRVNVEVKWMLGEVEPDFRTISEFRKENIDSIKKIFHGFNRRISDAVEWGFTSIDGSKFLACNPKNNNFTKNKLDDRIKWLNGHIEEYLRILDNTDKQEDFEEGPDRKKTAERMCLSEHPFGTIKRAMGSSYFLLKGLRKVAGGFALICLGYNIKRAKNLLGFEKMMEFMAVGTC